MTLPNFVIGGAPKCGTSSIHTWLLAHPSVCGSHRKETCYLMDEDHPLRAADNYHGSGVDGYRALFGHCAGAPVITEGTTHYLYQRTARRVLAGLENRPRMLFILRRPSERIYSSFRYSQHNQARLRSNVHFREFIRHVKAGDIGDLLVGNRGPRGRYVLEREIEFSRYAAYIAEWIADLGSDRVWVRLFEDMRRDPRGFMKQLARDLDIDPSFYDHYDLNTRNASFQARFPILHRLARRVSTALPGQSAGYARARDLYRRLLTQPPGQRTSADIATLVEIDDDLRSDTARLAELTQLDLSCWTSRRPSDPAPR